MKRNIDTGILIMRISLGILMLLHGSAKLLHGIDHIKGILTQAGLPSFVAYGVIAGEVIAPDFDPDRFQNTDRSGVLCRQLYFCYYFGAFH